MHRKTYFLTALCKIQVYNNADSACRSFVFSIPCVSWLIFKKKLVVGLCTKCQCNGYERFVGFVASIFRAQVSTKVTCLSYAGRKSWGSYVEPSYTK